MTYQQGSHAEGYNTKAAGNYSHAEGSGTVANGGLSHTEGYGTYAYGRGSHAEGCETIANGDYSHAEGRDTVANAGHAEGVGTTSSYDMQHVCGIYNIIDTNASYIEIVGCGNGDNSRANSRTLSIYGNEWIRGVLTQASDARLKTETGEVPDVSDIPARCFKWNDLKVRHDDKLHLGYFAQDVEKVAPYLVDEDAMGYKSLDYIGFLVAKIASLEKRVAELEARE